MDSDGSERHPVKGGGGLRQRLDDFYFGKLATCVALTPEKERQATTALAALRDELPSLESSNW